MDRKLVRDMRLCQGQDVTHSLACRVIIGIMCLMDAGTRQAWIPTDADFGSRLALIRHRMGWNMKEAARECGVPAPTWRLWEVEGALPRNIVTIAMAISQKAGCDYLWLVHGPDRGGMRPPTGYAPGARVLARIGDEPNGPARTAIHRAATTRPVSQTRPLRRGSSRPETPVAV